MNAVPESPGWHFAVAVTVVSESNGTTGPNLLLVLFTTDFWWSEIVLSRGLNVAETEYHTSWKRGRSLTTLLTEPLPSPTVKTSLPSSIEMFHPHPFSS